MVEDVVLNPATKKGGRKAYALPASLREILTDLETGKVPKSRRAEASKEVNRLFYQESHTEEQKLRGEFPGLKEILAA